MKFFEKNPASKINQQGLVYKENRSKANAEILKLLLLEQKNFCSYTEKYIQELDACEVEHFDASKKYNDNYLNYYAVIRKANQYKKDAQYAGASFFTNLFFQQPNGFNSRIKFVGGQYEG